MRVNTDHPSGKRKPKFCNLCQTPVQKLGLCDDCRSEQRGGYIPTPEQIKAEAAAIRETWTDQEKLNRRVYG